MESLKDKIRIGKNLFQDFVLNAENQKQISIILTSFANTEGGSLFVGIKDNGKVNGILPETELKYIQEAIDLYANPKLIFENKIHIDGPKMILEIIIQKSFEKHTSVDEEGKLKYFVRVEGKSIKANKILINIWNLEKKGIEKPTFLDEDSKMILHFITQNGVVNISKIYKSNSEISKSLVDSILSLLIHWNLVKIEFIYDGFYYKPTTL